MTNLRWLLVLLVVRCANSNPESDPPATEAEDALTVCHPRVAPANPAELVNYCNALPGVNANGVLDCIKGAAPSPTPAAVIDACKALTNVNVAGQLTCIAAVGGSLMP
jgi:hypothetical protein